MADPLDNRLSRIETKLDSLSEAITTLARIDERMLSHMQETRRMGSKIDALELQIDELREEKAAKSELSKIGDRVTALEFAKASVKGGWYVAAGLATVCISVLVAMLKQ